jgi:opacity protein-like surface antigen
MRLGKNAANWSGFFLGARRAALTLVAAVMMMVTFAPAKAASVPSDDEQEILIRTTLMTFNDANMTGNYSVLHAKASKEVQAQLSVEKLFETFKPFRTNQLFFEDIIYEDYDSYEDAMFDSDGALVLVGVFKTDRVKVSYRLEFVKNDAVWKWSGIKVNADKLRQ